jgi:flagellar FliL protein
MADEDADESEEGEDGEEGEEGESSGGGSKKLIIIIAAVVLLLVGGGAAAFFMGLFDPSPTDAPAEVKSDAGGKSDANANVIAPAVFYDLPEMQVNLNAGGRKGSLLKLRVSLELSSPEEVAKLEELMPRVVDSFQVYLRELRVNDLKGSAGIYRLREELMIRVNDAIAPTKIKAVLFKEMLVQ